MSKTWEYCVIHEGTRDVSISNADRYLDRVPGKILQVLNQLGEEGWEAFGFSASESGVQSFALRREKS